MTKQLLDIGCGPRKIPGAVGMDLLPLPGVDVVADLAAPWPFPDDAFDAITANHVLEHVPDVVHVMNEAWRVLRAGGTLTARGPHFSSPELVWSDPTHRRALSLAMFHHFLPDAVHAYAKAQFEIVRAELHLSADRTGRRWWKRLASPALRSFERWVNASPIQQSRAERLWSRVLPFSEVEVELRAIKNKA
jgi:SAM-dependent methyltransferase